MFRYSWLIALAFFCISFVPAMAAPLNAPSSDAWDAEIFQPLRELIRAPEANAVKLQGLIGRIIDASVLPRNFFLRMEQILSINGLTAENSLEAARTAIKNIAETTSLFRLLVDGVYLLRSVRGQYGDAELRNAFVMFLAIGRVERQWQRFHVIIEGRYATKPFGVYDAPKPAALSELALRAIKDMRAISMIPKEAAFRTHMLESAIDGLLDGRLMSEYTAYARYKAAKNILKTYGREISDADRARLHAQVKSKRVSFLNVLFCHR